MSAVRKYRFVARDGSYRTRWRCLPAGKLLPRPRKLARERLGAGYSVQIRSGAK
jgi:hypothetical protein